MNSDRQCVFLVDDDPDFRILIATLLRSRGKEVVEFDSAESFLESYTSAFSGCILLDLSMPGMSGLELQRELVERENSIPIIFLTGSATIPQSVQALKQGAVDFLEKSAQAEIILDQVEQAFTQDTELRYERRERANAKSRLELLTQREREVFDCLISTPNGLSSKEVARLLSISPRTVDQHRARVMEKTQSRSITELFNFAERAGVVKLGRVVRLNDGIAVDSMTCAAK